MKWAWLWKLTGGRPMRYIRDHFIDVVSDKMVSDYMDRNGKYWMAEHKWALFRVPLRGAQIMDALQKRPVDMVEYTIATVVSPDGTSRKEWVPAKPFMEMMAEAMAMLDAARHPDVSSGDEH